MPFSSSTVANLYFWVKGDAGITQSAGAVSAWADQSGNSRDLNVASVTKPTYSATVLGSLPAVVFNHGSGTFLQTAAFASTLAQPTTIFAVCKLTNASPAPGGIVDGIDGTNRNFLADYGTLSSSILETYAGTAALDSSTGHTTYNNPSVVTAVFDAASSVIRQNGKQVASGTSPGTAGLAGLTVGSRFGLFTTYGWDGPIAEVLVYSRHLSASEIGQVEDYLAGKYSIAAGYLDANATGQAVATATLLTTLSATAIGQSVATASLTASLVASSATGQAVATASLGATLLPSVSAGQAVATASLQALLGAVATGQGVATATGQALLGANATGQAVATASLQDLLSANATGQTVATAALSVSSAIFNLSANAIGQAVATATLSPFSASSTITLTAFAVGSSTGRLANGLAGPYASLTYVSRGAFASVGTYGATPIPPPAVGAKLPAFDPLLQYLGQFCQQVMNAYGSASWVSVVPGTGPNPVRTVRLVRPKHIMFNEKDLPALYLWREGGKPMEWMAEDILCKHDTVRALWLFPTHTQENQQYRTTYIDQLIKIVHACVSTGRDPAFQVPGDTQAQAAPYGSVLWDWAGLSQLYFRSWERQDFVLPVEGQAARTYEGVQLELETLELFHPDATQYDALGSLDVQILETDPVLGTQIKAEGFL